MLAVSCGLAACGSDEDSAASTQTSAVVVSGADSAENTHHPADGTHSHDAEDTHGHDDQATDAPDAPTAGTLRATLARLADPAVPTADKAAAIVDGEQRTENIDRMNAGLQGYPLTFTVAEVAVHGLVATAQVTIESPHGVAPAIPLTWQNIDDTWKLSNESGCQLLGLAQAPCT